MKVQSHSSVSAAAALLFVFAIFAQASSIEADQLKSVKENIKGFRLQFTLFDQDKSQDDRSVDVMVGNEDINAEGIITQTQALGLVDVLAADGFFRRAQQMGKVEWKPPEQPFYVVWVRSDDSSGLYEFRKEDPELTGLLVRVRDKLAQGLAAKSVDRAVAALDPKQCRWNLATDTLTKLSLPELPAGESSCHPDYSFEPVQDSWKVRETYLKPSNGAFIASTVADDTTLEKYKLWFRQLSYSMGPDDRDCKIVTFYPSGALYSEVDSFETGVDLPRGDIYERLFNEHGNILYYDHSKDGRVVDAASFDVRGKLKNRISGGNGFVTQPTFDSAVSNSTWYYQGLILFRRQEGNDRRSFETLNDNTESGHAAALTIFPDGSESLYQDELHWKRSADGKVEREVLYREASDHPSSSQLSEQFIAARRKFFSRFEARAEAGGFSLSGLGLDSEKSH